jgi:UDP-N-acetyl-D-mannosaminuronic acid dehydrogenase
VVREPTVAVIGLGRVGLPTGVLLARAGEVVLGVDRDPAVCARVRAGHAGAEPGLAHALRGVLASGHLRVSERQESAPAAIVCVPTPLRDGAADLAALEDAVRDLALVLPPRAVVVIESTVPVGTTAGIARRLRERRPDAAVAFCPERVLPGDALREIAGNDRVVGGVDAASAEAAAVVLRRYVTGRIDRTDDRTAELVKLVENASRDVGIAFANTAAALAERLGVDPAELRALCNRHPRVALHEAGIGVGGHCLPVDPWFLVAAAPEEAELLRVARRINDGVPGRVAARLLASIPPDASVAVLGLAYKADVDDLRNSPALAVATALSEARDVVVCDPLVDAELVSLRQVRLDEALGADVLVLLVPHRVFAGIGSRLRPGQPLLDPTHATFR